MKQLVALAIDSIHNWCTCIYSEATYEQLKEHYSLYVKEYRATDWNGCDDIERTLKLKGLRFVGTSFAHEETISGVDHDMGHTYPWSFTFDTVAKVEPAV